MTIKGDRLAADTDMNNSHGNLAATEPSRLMEGQLVRIGKGPLTGLEGILVDHRPGGRCVVELNPGVLLETDVACFQT